MKKLLSIVLSATLLALVLAGCSGSKGNAETQKLVVGASPAPHAEILEFVKPLLKDEGIKLEIKTFTDYVLPNTALSAKEIDANFFQHQPYLDTYNESNKTDIVSVAKVHFEPMGIYPGKIDNVDKLQNGDSIAIPNDTANEARALRLLEAQGVINLKDGVGLKATPKDIVENKKGLKFVELAAEQVAKSLPDVALGVVNGNYAIEEKMEDKALAKESSDSEGAKTYANILAVLPENKDDARIQKLVEILNSDKVRNFLNDKYKNTFVPVF